MPVNSGRHASSRKRLPPEGRPVQQTRPSSQKGKFKVWLGNTKRERHEPSESDVEVDLRDAQELESCIGSLWKGERLPRKLSLFCIKAKDVGMSLDRDQKRALLKALANTEIYPKKEMHLSIRTVKSETGGEHEGIDKKAELSYAAILIIDLALRDEQDIDTRDLFAEMVGCATPDTILELSFVLRYPFITLTELPTLIHCTVRHIARIDKNDRAKQPVKLAIETATAIATTLEHAEELQPQKLRADRSLWSGKYDRVGREKALVSSCKRALDDLLFGTLRRAKYLQENYYADDDDAARQNPVQTDEKNKEKESKEDRLYRYSRDLGCHAGLLLAGIQAYFLRSKENDEDMEIKCDLLIDVMSGFLNGVPTVGFVFGPAGSVAKTLFHKFSSEKKKKRREQVSQGIKEYFDESVWAPIFFDDEFFLEDAHGTALIAPEKVEWAVFSKWYEQIIRWNQAFVNWH